ncbi:MAG: MFS transporter [Actinomycetota bacterium]
MILVVFVALSALAVPLARGRLLALAGLRFRRAWLIPLALGLQVLITVLWTGSQTQLHDFLHVSSYALAALFLVFNRRIPGIWLIALGAALNVLAIVSNGGVMPASPHALALAGLPSATPGFSNSAAVVSPHLAFLGDVFAIPRSWPLSNVFSVGDVCVALGCALMLHRVCGSVLVPSGKGQFSPLLKRPTFMRLWGSQAVSNIGDWTYAIAVGTMLVRRTHSPQMLSMLLICQVAPAALFGGLLGGLADRYSRVRLMIISDVVRAAAVGSLFIAPPSSMHLFAVAGLLGIFGALFQPSLQASIPNAVEEKEVVAANAMVGATFHFAIMAGPALGGFLVAQLGTTPVFAINALSFFVSAALLTGLRLPHPGANRDPEVKREHTAVRDLVEGARYTMSTPLVRGMMLVIGIVLVAAAAKAPLESLFVLSTLSLDPQALGFILGCWGLGMLLGSISAPAICRRWPREKVLALTIAAVGIAVLIASQAQNLETVLLLWLLAGAANSIANVSYESLLQERTPDDFRGRVFAAFEFVTNLAFLAGALFAGWLGSRLGIRMSYVFSGVLFLSAAIVCRVLLPNTTTKGLKALVIGFGADAPQAAARAEMETETGSPFTEPILEPILESREITPTVHGQWPQSIGATMHALRDPSAQVRRRAAVELGRLHAVEALPALGRAFDDPDPLVREAVVRAVGSMPVTGVETALVQALADLSADVRSAASDHLVLRRSDRVVAALTQALEIPTLEEAALSVLSRIGPEWFGQDLSSLDPERRRAAVEVLAAMGGPVGTESLVRSLADPDPELRARSAELLGRLGDPAVRDVLERALDDPIESVAMAVRRALTALETAERESALAT